MDLYFGIDVASKDFVSGNLDMGTVKVDNQLPAIKKFIKQLPQGAIMGIEATGGYGTLLADTAFEAGICVYIIRPDKVKKFREAGPERSKTDAIDAMVIRDYLETYINKLHTYSPLPALEASIRKLSRKRDKIVQKLSDLRKTLRSLGDSVKQVQLILAPIEKRVLKCEQELAKLVAQAQDAKVLFSITSVKLVTIASVLPAIRSIQFESKYALDSYFGMDLKANESGQKVGERHMSKQGDKRARKALYMAAVSAAGSKTFRGYYQMLKNEKKLKPKQALNALARKILHIIYGVYYSQTEFKAPTYS